VLQQIYRSAIRSSFYWIVPVIISLGFFSEMLLHLFGPMFAQGALALTILLSGILFDNFARITTGLIGGLNRPGLKALIIVAGAVTNLTLNGLLIPHYGIVGAAWANTLGYIVTAVICSIWISRYWGKGMSLRQLTVDLHRLIICNTLTLLLFGVLHQSVQSGASIHVFWLCLIPLGLYYGPGRKYLLTERIGLSAPVNPLPR
jgi:O-antigen/teichoic acid export membrane protein